MIVRYSYKYSICPWRDRWRHRTCDSWSLELRDCYVTTSAFPSFSETLLRRSLSNVKSRECWLMWILCSRDFHGPRETLLYLEVDRALASRMDVTSVIWTIRFVFAMSSCQALLVASQSVPQWTLRNSSSTSKVVCWTSHDGFLSSGRTPSVSIVLCRCLTLSLSPLSLLFSSWL